MRYTYAFSRMKTFSFCMWNIFLNVHCAMDTSKMWMWFTNMVLYPFVQLTMLTEIRYDFWYVYQCSAANLRLSKCQSKVHVRVHWFSQLASHSLFYICMSMYYFDPGMNLRTNFRCCRMFQYFSQTTVRWQEALAISQSPPDAFQSSNLLHFNFQHPVFMIKSIYLSLSLPMCMSVCQTKIYGYTWFFYTNWKMMHKIYEGSAETRVCFSQWIDCIICVRILCDVF